MKIIYMDGTEWVKFELSAGSYKKGEVIKDPDGNSTRQATEEEELDLPALKARHAEALKKTR